MQTYEAIENGIRERDVEALREAIGGLCYACPDFSDGEFDEVVAYVTTQEIPLLDPALDGELIGTDKESFTDEDFARAVFELKRNFCEERIADVKAIGMALYGENTDVETGDDPNAEGHQTLDIKKLKIAGLVAAAVAVVAVTILSVILLMK